MKHELRMALPGGTFRGVSTGRSRVMSAIRGAANRTTEGRLRALLVQAGVRGWVLRPTRLIGSPDFFFPGLQIAIFVDGCFWHGCPTCGHIPKTRSSFWAMKIKLNRLRDRQVVSRLRRSGILTIRFWECQLAESGSACVETICQVLNRCNRRSPPGRRLRDVMPPSNT